ncbi:MAG: nucleoside deaminase [Candidatus Aureabacteria bacterium]|nr:nucleoside deaminase [Candidatus Auribacterota bacterium]
MLLAIEKARTGINQGQTPFGACLVRKEEVISCEHNNVWNNLDITAHAEIIAIRKACKKLGTIDLSGCVMFSTCEPCPMCFSACHWARISKIYYGAGIEDAKKYGFNEIEISNDFMKEKGKSPIKIEKDFLRNECIQLFKEWSKSTDKNVY